MSAIPVMISGKVANLIRLLSSNHAGQIVATVHAIIRTLESNGISIHTLAEHVENGGGLTEADKQKNPQRDRERACRRVRRRRQGGRSQAARHGRVL